MSTDTRRQPVAGEQVHFLISGMTYRVRDDFAAGQVSHKAQTVTLTDPLIEAARGRDGIGFWDLAYDAEEQVRRYHRQVIAPGPAPDHLVPWEPGSIEEKDAEERERRHIETTVADGPEKTAALARHRQRFPVRSTQRSHDLIGDRERQAYLQSVGAFDPSLSRVRYDDRDLR